MSLQILLKLNIENGLNKFILFYIIVLLGCMNSNEIQSLQFSVNDELVKLNFSLREQPLEFASSQKLDLNHQYAEMFLDSINKIVLKTSYTFPQNGEYEFWNEESNFKHLVESRVPVDCGLFVDKQPYKFEKGFITDSVVIFEGIIHFKKVISIYTKINGVFTINYEREYLKNEFSLERILKNNSFMNDVRIIYNHKTL